MFPKFLAQINYYWLADASAVIGDAFVTCLSITSYKRFRPSFPFIAGADDPQ